MKKEPAGAEEFTHFDKSGNAIMVDVGDKPITARHAVACGTITMSQKAFEMVKSGSMTKGDVLGVARIAGIMAAKKVDALIPLTHPLNISKADIHFSFDGPPNTITIQSEVGITGKTGVEMEALTAVSLAALTIYDMCKAVDKGMEINNIHLITKTGGKSGPYKREQRNRRF